MTPKLKKIIALCLVIAVGVVWIPQIITASTKRAPVVIPEVPALGSDAAPVASRSASTNSAEVGANASESASGANQDDLAHALEASIAKAKLVVPEKSGFDLTQLASAWAAPTTAPASVVPPLSTTIELLSTQAPPAPLVVDISLKRDPIDDFLATHPLQGTLIGATQRLACLGPLLVAVGDEPVKGLTVSAIEPRFVTFSRAGDVVRVGLIPFQARAPIAQATTSNSTTNSGGTPTGGATQLGASTAASVTGELDKLLPILKQAAADAANGSSASDASKDTSKAQTSGSKDGQGS